MMKFGRKRRSRKGLVLILLVLAVFIGSNALGYFLARDQIDSALRPSAMPEGNPLPFGRTFRVVMPEYVLTAPFEIGGYSLAGAIPYNLTLNYVDYAADAAMDVTISDSKFFYETDRTLRLPQSLLSGKGFSGNLIYEIFAKGPGSDGIHLNPYMCIREGLAARLRGDLSSVALPAKMDAIHVYGDSKAGQVWRVYRDDKGRASLVEGTIYDPENLVNISMKFRGPTADLGPIINQFSGAMEFKKGDASINESMADSCVSTLPHDTEPTWEPGCRQVHLVAALISIGDTVHIAKRLYGEYLADNNKKGIKALFHELHFEMHMVKGWEKFAMQMKKENEWLVPKQEMETKE